MARRRERPLDHRALGAAQRRRQDPAVALGRSRSGLETEVRRLDERSGREHDRVLDRIGELAHVAGPGPGDERGHRARRQLEARAAVLLGEAGEKVLREQRDVVDALGERRHVHGGDLQAEVEVLAKASFAHGTLEILVRRRDHAHVDGERPGAAHAHHLALLEHAEHLGLHGEAHVADLVEEEGPAVRPLDEPRALLDARRHAAFDAEKLALEQRLGQRRAVDGDERSAAAAAVMVERARDQLLPRPARAEHEDRDVGGGEPLDDPEHPAEGGARTDEHRLARSGVERGAQAAVFGSEPLVERRVLKRHRDRRRDQPEQTLVLGADRPGRRRPEHEHARNPPADPHGVEEKRPQARCLRGKLLGRHLGGVGDERRLPGSGAAERAGREGDERRGVPGDLGLRPLPRQRERAEPARGGIAPPQPCQLDLRLLAQQGRHRAADRRRRHLARERIAHEAHERQLVEPPQQLGGRLAQRAPQRLVAHTIRG